MLLLCITSLSQVSTDELTLIHNLRKMLRNDWVNVLDYATRHHNYYTLKSSIIYEIVGPVCLMLSFFYFLLS